MQLGGPPVDRRKYSFAKYSDREVFIRTSLGPDPGRAVVESSQRRHHRKNASTFQTTRLSETSFNAVVAEVFDRSQKLLRYLFDDLGKIRAESCPFLMFWQLAGAIGSKGRRAARMKRFHWVKAAMVCEIKFMKRTRIIVSSSEPLSG